MAEIVLNPFEENQFTVRRKLSNPIHKTLSNEDFKKCVDEFVSDCPVEIKLLGIESDRFLIINNKIVLDEMFVYRFKIEDKNNFMEWFEQHPTAEVRDDDYSLF